MRIAIALSLLATLTAGTVPAQSVHVQVDATKVAGYRLPPTIYGSFLEPIGHSIYGGLWAQLLVNPSFEDNLWSLRSMRAMADENPSLQRASQLGLPLPWEPLHPAQGARYEPRWGDAANSHRSLLVMAIPAVETGVRQIVYLPVHRVLSYRGSLYARHISGPAAVEVSLRKRDAPETVLTKATIALSGAGWRKYEFSLALPAGALARLDPADFVLALPPDGRALLDQVTLVPTDAVEGMDPDMIALARHMRTPLVRYGGNFTSAYHWKDGVGEPDKRVSMLNLAWGMPEYNSFGTDEFLAFCRLIEARPQICLNLGTGTPEEAADWIRYVNARWNGGKGGLLWEMGNELWGDFQTGYPTRERIGELTGRYLDAVHKADAGARFIATGADPDHFQEWNAEQLKLPRGAFHYLSTHFVVGNGNVRRPNAPPEFLALASFAEPVELERRLRAMDAQIRAAGSDARIAFTEWLFSGPEDRAPMFLNMGGAVSTGGFFNMLFRVADIVPVSDMTGIIEFGGIYQKRSQVFGTPAYYAFRMYSTSGVTRPVAVETDSERYSVREGNVRLPEIADVPYLDVVAALDEAGNQLSVFVVNRHLTRDQQAQLSLKGFAPAAAARIETLSAPHIYTQNDALRPTAVTPREATAALRDGALEWTFPRSSITRIDLRK